MNGDRPGKPPKAFSQASKPPSPVQDKQLGRLVLYWGGRTKRKGAFIPFTCARTHTYPHAYTNTHTPIRACTHIRTRTHTHTRTHTYARTSTQCMHACMHTTVHTGTYTTHAHTYAHAHTHTHKRTHVRARTHTCACTHTYACTRACILMQVELIGPEGPRIGSHLVY